MSWDVNEALAYYRRQGAPGDQNALRSLLAEIQTEYGGAIPQYLLPTVAAELGTKESFLAAIIRRIPSLRLQDHHLLEICAGPNCPKRANLADFAEKTYGKRPGLTIRTVPCMRMCGKGPNIKWDGVIHHQATEQLLEQLIKTMK